MNFSVMAMNLRVNNPLDGKDAWPYRAYKVIELFKMQSPAIIGTQEGLFSMLAEIQKELPEYKCIGTSRGAIPEDEHCAIFYKTAELELVHQGQFWLSETPEQTNSKSWDSAFPRICTWGAFRFRKDYNRQIMVYNTHLDHVSQRAREKGIQLILDKMKDHIQNNWPVILTGDLNVTPENQVIQLFEHTSLRDTYSKMHVFPGVTFHNFQGGQEGETIDYIFVSPNVKVMETKVNRNLIDGGFPSDHYPVSAQLYV